MTSGSSSESSESSALISFTVGSDVFFALGCFDWNRCAFLYRIEHFLCLVLNLIFLYFYRCRRIFEFTITLIILTLKITSAGKSLIIGMIMVKNREVKELKFSLPQNMSTSDSIVFFRWNMYDILRVKGDIWLNWPSIRIVSR